VLRARACPTRPVYRGEIQGRGLGLDVDVYDEHGRPIAGEQGELVCKSPFPCMPVGFWNDADGAKYRAAYFERFPGVWCHGDWAELTSHDGMIIYGRSDTTLNPGGVRIGTAEIYRKVEQLPEVVESLVIGQDWPPGEVGDVRVVLFVKLADGVALDEALDRPHQAHDPHQHDAAARSRQGRAGHDIPRTKSGKIVELAVRNVVHGREVRNIEGARQSRSARAIPRPRELKS
jgi:acetoacetyl-CoA synthetase